MITRLEKKSVKLFKKKIFNYINSLLSKFSGRARSDELLSMNSYIKHCIYNHLNLKIGIKTDNF